MCPCVRVSLHQCIRASMYPYIPASVYPCIHVSMYQCIPTPMWSYICAPVTPCARVSVHLHVRPSVCPCILPVSMRPCICASIYLCIRVSVCPCVRTRPLKVPSVLHRGQDVTTQEVVAAGGRIPKAMAGSRCPCSAPNLLFPSPGAASPAGAGTRALGLFLRSGCQNKKGRK